MKKWWIVAVALLAIAPASAHAASIGLGVFGGYNIPVVQDDVDNGPVYGLRAPVKLIPLVTVEPFYAMSALGDKSLDVGGIEFTRDGFEAKSYGVNAMLTMGGPVQFYPWAGIGSTSLERDGETNSFVTYSGGIGLGFNAVPKVALHVRGGVDVVVDGETSRKFANVTVGASYSLFSMP